MPTRLTSTEFLAAHDVPDWRVLLRSIEAWFVAPTFSAGAAFISDVAAAADRVGHHPDVDLRHPGRVHVLITSHDAHGLTDRDAALAETISGLAAAGGLVSEPRTSTRLEVAIDALDIDLVRPFWVAVLAYENDPSFEAGEVVDGIRDPLGIGAAFWFQQMDEPRPHRNRIHVDVIVPEDEVADRIAAALSAGGVMISEEQAPAFWVLADAEGNEACLCTWQGRG